MKNVSLRFEKNLHFSAHFPQKVLNFLKKKVFNFQETFSRTPKKCQHNSKIRRNFQPILEHILALMTQKFKSIEILQYF